jgi:hypothetical protein
VGGGADDIERDGIDRKGGPRLLRRIPPELRAQFEERRIDTNVNRMYFFSICVVVLQIVLNVLNILKPSGGRDYEASGGRTVEIMHYVALSLFTLLIGLLFFFLLSRVRKKRISGRGGKAFLVNAFLHAHGHSDKPDRHNGSVRLRFRVFVRHVRAARRSRAGGGNDDILTAGAYPRAVKRDTDARRASVVFLIRILFITVFSILTSSSHNGIILNSEINHPAARPRGIEPVLRNKQVDGSKADHAICGTENPVS